MLVHIKEVMKAAKRKSYAVGAFNVFDLESVLAVVRAAKNKNAPAIIQVSEKTIIYAGLKNIFSIIKSVAETEAKNLPLAVHLDHGKSLKIITECLWVGFSSVHCDASEFDFEKNIKLTRRAVEIGHRFGAWVQGELGSLYGQEGKTKISLPQDPEVYLTNPKKVKEYVKRTKVDALAVSLGTFHGSFKGQEKIDFPRLKAIKKQTSAPLVLHGASGVKPTDLKKAVRSGISIVNLDTELRMAFTGALRKILKKKINFYDPRKVLTPSIQATQDAVENKLALFKK